MAQKSKLNSFPGFSIGSTLNISIVKYGAYYDVLTVKNDSGTTVGTYTNSQAAGTRTISINTDTDIYYQSVTLHTQCMFTFTLKTYTSNGGTLIGTSTYQQDGDITGSYEPTVTFTVSPYPVMLGDNTKYIKGKNRYYVQAYITPPRGATITSRKVKGAGFSGNMTLVDEGVNNLWGFAPTTNFAVSGTVDVTMQLTDSRYNDFVYKQSITISDYTPISFSTFGYERGDYVDDVFTENDYGDDLRVEVQLSVPFPEIGNSAQSVQVTLNAPSGVIILQPTQTAINVQSDTIKYFGYSTVPNEYTYTLTATATDGLSDTTIPEPITVTPIDVTMDIRGSGNGIAFGKVAETDDVFDVDWLLQARKGLSFRDTNNNAIDGLLKSQQNNGYVNIAGVKIAWGYVNIVPTAANEPTAESVAFPTYAANGVETPIFAVAPMVFVNSASASPGVAVKGVSSQGATASGCNIYLTRANTDSTRVMWLAIGI